MYELLVLTSGSTTSQPVGFEDLTSTGGDHGCVFFITAPSKKNIKEKSAQRTRSQCRLTCLISPNRTTRTASRMKLSSIILAVAALGSAADASPVNTTDPEVAATLRIRSHQTTYQKYIQETIKTRKTGCTSKNIVKRKEWCVSNRISPHLRLQGVKLTKHLVYKQGNAFQA